MPFPAFAAVNTFLGTKVGETLLGGLSGLFGGRSKRKEAKAQREHEERQNRLQFEGQKYLIDSQRKNELQDRRYKEDAIGGYRGFYGGKRSFLAPVMTDPESVKLQDPYAGAKR